MSHTITGSTSTSASATQLTSETRRVRRIYFKSNPSNGADVTIGDSGVGVNNGIRVDQADRTLHDISYEPSSESADFFHVVAESGTQILDWLMVLVDSPVRRV